MKLNSPSQLKVTTRLLSRPFTNTPHLSAAPNRILDPVRIPPTFHDYLRSCSANNTLLLGLFTTSACTPCRTITPLLTSIIESRQPIPSSDSFSRLAFAEIELDSPDTSNGSTMMELGMVYGVASLPTLIGFGGRRAERVTERLVDTKMLSDRRRMEAWIDEQMRRGDQHPSPSSSDGGMGGSGKGLLQRIFG